MTLLCWNGCAIYYIGPCRPKFSCIIFMCCDYIYDVSWLLFMVNVFILVVVVSIRVVVVLLQVVVVLVHVVVVFILVVVVYIHVVGIYFCTMTISIIVFSWLLSIIYQKYGAKESKGYTRNTRYDTSRYPQVGQG